MAEVPTQNRPDAHGDNPAETTAVTGSPRQAARNIRRNNKELHGLSGRWDGRRLSRSMPDNC